ncbi:NGB-like protein [Mya arenaria]|uniref:NGB-like protein n=1 Tax=Mya arenaria TaxID=6604 RepID=A0ABY7F8U8_MYAAR|nr:neuroglobin-like [Mya arenaria]WAR18430.1 NGB-like protein [Mya arenaria]
MGCNSSSVDDILKGKDARKQSAWKKDSSNITSPVDNGNDKFDPRLPLTVRQKFNIMKSWKGIARNIEATGVLMFLRLFETNEEVRTMFTKLVHDGKYDIAQLRESKELENHVKQVMYTLDEAISSLEDVDVTVNLLLSVGSSHRRLKERGFNPAVFWKIEEPFLVAVKETLGDRYTANMEHIYRKTIKFILETLIEGFNKK